MTASSRTFELENDEKSLKSKILFVFGNLNYASLLIDSKFT